MRKFTLFVVLALITCFMLNAVAAETNDKNLYTWTVGRRYTVQTEMDVMKYINGNTWLASKMAEDMGFDGWEETCDAADDLFDMKREELATDQLIMLNAQEQLERDSIIYNEVKPILTNSDMTADEKYNAIIELNNKWIAEREEQDALIKDPNIPLEEKLTKELRRQVIPEGLLDLLVGEVTWEKIKGLDYKTIREKDMAFVLSEFGITVDKKEFRLKDGEEEQNRIRELNQYLAALSNDQVTDLKLQIVAVYYELDKAQQKALKRENTLLETKKEYEDLKAEILKRLPFDTLQLCQITPHRIKIKLLWQDSLIDQMKVCVDYVLESKIQFDSSVLGDAYHIDDPNSELMINFDYIVCIVKAIEQCADLR